MNPKRLLFVLLALCLPLRAELITDRLIDALVAVESAGNPRAIGDGGKAYGILQIHPGTVADVNRILGTDFTHEDAFRPVVARLICRAYLGHYVTAKRLGREPTAQDAARCWNGGPNGWRKPATLRYWHRVSQHLSLSSAPSGG